MTRINQFESAFLSADKAVYRYEPLAVDSVLFVNDLEADAAIPLLEQVRGFLSIIDTDSTQWSRLDGDSFESVRQLLDSIAERQPDLIVTYRHLHSSAWQWPHSLGEYLDVLTQATNIPVVVVPHPDANRALPHTLQDTNRVMAITDHLTGDDRLVNHAIGLTEHGGSCWLTHVEPQPGFDRYLGAIAKIPEIDTELARELVERQLLKQPHDYIRSCRRTLGEQNLPVVLEEIVTMGRRLSEYQRLIDEHAIDLLVFNTLDDDQFAMHGLAYPLAVELRQIPLLML